MDHNVKKAQKVWAFLSFWSTVKSSVVENFEDVKANKIQRIMPAGDLIMSTPYTGECLCGSSLIFEAAGANWCEVSDGLPKFKAGRDSEAFDQ